MFSIIDRSYKAKRLRPRRQRWKDVTTSDDETQYYSGSVRISLFVQSHTHTNTSPHTSYRYVVKHEVLIATLQPRHIHRRWTSMDFRSLLDQFQKNAATQGSTSLTATLRRRREGEDNANNNNPNEHSNKRQRQQQQQQPTFTFLPAAPVRSIFCLCPAGVETGGPEALHQLCDVINRCCYSFSSSSDPNLNDQHPPSNEQCVEVSAFMLYMQTNHNNDKRSVIWARHATTPTIYQSYQVPTARWDPRKPTSDSETIKCKSCLMIWPEVWTDAMLKYLNAQQEQQEQQKTTTVTAAATANTAITASSSSPSSSSCCQCAIWWLSVDNNHGRFQEWHRRDVLHLVQSEYARQYVLSNGVPTTHIVAMTEYISNLNLPITNDSFMTTTAAIAAAAATTTQTTNDDANQRQQGNSGKDAAEVTNNGDAPVTVPGVVAGGAAGAVVRDIDVLYNPLKGLHYTDAIRKRSQGLCTFEPIFDGSRRISPTEVRQKLQRAKMYLDFGPHPGMDRLPREAAVCGGCVVITNQQGAAKFCEDVPIPIKYKLHEFDIDVIHKLLRHVLEHWEESVQDFEEYRHWIRGQEERMQQCVQHLLNVVCQQRATRK